MHGRPGCHSNSPGDNAFSLLTKWHQRRAPASPLITQFHKEVHKTTSRHRIIKCVDCKVQYSMHAPLMFKFFVLPSYDGSRSKYVSRLHTVRTDWVPEPVSCLQATGSVKLSNFSNKCLTVAVARIPSFLPRLLPHSFESYTVLPETFLGPIQTDGHWHSTLRDLLKT